jgi:hypothetical protein
VPDEPKEPEATRMQRDLSHAKKALFIIFGFGAIAVTLVIVYVMHHLPPGELQSGYGAKAPLGQKVRPPSTGWCKHFGDPCEFSPGKLGTCIAREGCSGGDCLFCQSQH